MLSSLIVIATLVGFHDWEHCGTAEFSVRGQNQSPSVIAWVVVGIGRNS